MNSLLVKNEAGAIDHFVREKLLLSIYDSLKHRKNSISDSIAITDTIVAKLISKPSTPLIERNVLINISHEVLANFDKPAAVHYLAYNPIK